MTPSMPVIATKESVAAKEFDNLLHIYKALRQNDAKTVSDLKRIDYQFRIDLFSEYYNISQEEIEKLIEISPSQRSGVCKAKGVNRFILRTLFDYNRYPECYILHNFLSQSFDFENKNLLDFGCLVSDYGFYFGMLNMNVTICDLKEHVDFADFRLGRANINRLKFYAPANYNDITKSQDMAIFGEVLEHLKDPYALLKSCVENKVKYIFTSCYPYGDEYYFSLPGHTAEAKEQAPKCIELLRENYEEIELIKRFTLWIEKA